MFKAQSLQNLLHCRANSAHMRQSKPDFGLGWKMKVRTPFKVVPSSLGSGRIQFLISWRGGHPRGVHCRCVRRQVSALDCQLRDS